MSRRPRCRRPGAASTAGVSLIEVIVAVFVMSIAFAVIVGGVATAVLGSNQERRQTTADVALRNAAEALSYDACAAYGPSLPAPSGFAVSVTDVAYLPAGGTQYVAGADPNCATDPPLQLVGLHVESTSGRPVSRDLQVVKRP